MSRSRGFLYNRFTVWTIADYCNHEYKWNQKVLSDIGKGPTPPDDEEGKTHITPEEAKQFAKYAAQRMRITCGYRTGIIAGGPQGEAPMLRASHTKGSAAEMIITGGCRGCIARKMWPGAAETTAHMHNCPGKQIEDLIRWKTDVKKKLQHLLIYLIKIGPDARTAREQVKQAHAVIDSRTMHGEGYEALRHTVGGAIPQWNDNIGKHDSQHNQRLTLMLVGIQKLFIERVVGWTKFMAPTGWQRQSRWHGRGWVRLIFHMLKVNAKGRTRRVTALRKVGTTLLELYRTPHIRTQLLHTKQVHLENKRHAYIRLNTILWNIFRTQLNTKG